MYIPTPPAVAATIDARTPSINTQFSPANQNIRFTSNAADYFQHRPVGKETTPGSRHSDAAPINGATRSQSVPHRKPVPGSPGIGVDGVPIGMLNLNAGPQNISPEEPFKGEFWAEQLKQHAWEQLSPRASSPGRAGSLSKPQSSGRQKPHKPGLASSPTRRSVRPEPARAETSSDSSDEQSSAVPSGPHTMRNLDGLNANVTEDGSPMDIDMATPPITKPAPAGVASADPHAADFLRDSPNARAENATREDATGTMAGAKDTAEASSTSPPSRPVRPGVTVEDMPSFSELDLGSLKNVEPLAPSAQGPMDMKDLQSTLPFTSQAAAVPPISGGGGDYYEPRILELPAPPKAPAAPSSVGQSSWESYVASTRAYMYEWSQFVDRMLAHFNERQREAKEGLSPNWLGLLAEGPRGGYGRYMQGVEEDFRVREHWAVAWEKHRDLMRAFGHVRAMAIEQDLQAA